VPLVSTRVGQAAEILADGSAAMLADVDDAEALAGQLCRLRDDPALAAELRSAGRAVAEAYAYPQLDSRWAELLEGFVELGR
jgi:glycosyltransferase involved in cell wall biosynthesis